jgi:hypothetical protein
VRWSSSPRARPAGSATAGSVPSTCSSASPRSRPAWPGACSRDRRGRCRRGRISPSWCFTPRAKKALQLALEEALGRGDRFVGAEHVLLGLLREGEGLAARLLADARVTVEWARAAVDEETRLAG